ncbi:2S seed storage protein 4 [Raphanus sativus]|uniref:Napin-B n=1 Tax=Raphanus sativus TaxID=3726 RepID=A0A6J0KR34_RAPSA|nr:napin-B [Raphanus sativus]KAJ4880433.1 2S seed storage protein 4 [Raphanus sativus]
MADKLFLVSATLAFFFLLTNASIYRTVVEFDEDDTINPIGPNQKCQKEFQQTQHLRPCQQWIHMQAIQPHVPSVLDGEFHMEDDMENPEVPQRPPLLQQCCNLLHQEDKICVCPALKHASKEVKSQVQQGQQQGDPQLISRIYETATHLPSICNVQQISVCPFKQDMPSFPSYY